MKKGLGLLAAGGCLFMLLLLVCTGGGGSGGAAVLPFADADEAYMYQYIGSELGTPWDIVMLADGIHAYAAGENGLKNYNPMLTSLQFCILMEEEFEAVRVTEEETKEPGDANGPEEESGESSGASEEAAPEETTEASGEGGEEGEAPVQEVTWVSREIRYYTGLDEILGYLGTEKDAAGLTYMDAAGIITGLTEKAEAKSTEEARYEATLLTNQDYETVLRDFVGLSGQYIENVLELYDSNYLAALYGYDFEFGDIELPAVVQGNVTREDLARVAVSLINHPYLMGGKSTQAGPPVGPWTAQASLTGSICSALGRQ